MQTELLKVAEMTAAAVVINDTSEHSRGLT